jgi:hypothetical protein
MLSDGSVSSLVIMVYLISVKISEISSFVIIFFLRGHFGGTARPIAWQGPKAGTVNMNHATGNRENRRFCNRVIVTVSPRVQSGSGWRQRKPNGTKRLAKPPGVCRAF